MAGNIKTKKKYKGKTYKVLYTPDGRKIYSGRMPKQKSVKTLEKELEKTKEDFKSGKISKAERKQNTAKLQKMLRNRGAKPPPNEKIKFKQSPPHKLSKEREKGHHRRAYHKEKKKKKKERPIIIDSLKPIFRWEWVNVKGKKVLKKVKVKSKWKP